MTQISRSQYIWTHLKYFFDVSGKWRFFATVILVLVAAFQHSTYSVAYYVISYILALAMFCAWVEWKLINSNIDLYNWICRVFDRPEMTKFTQEELEADDES